MYSTKKNDKTSNFFAQRSISDEKRLPPIKPHVDSVSNFSVIPVLPLNQHNLLPIEHIGGSKQVAHVSSLALSLNKPTLPPIEKRPSSSSKKEYVDASLMQQRPISRKTEQNEPVVQSTLKECLAKHVIFENKRPLNGTPTSCSDSIIDESEQAFGGMIEWNNCKELSLSPQDFDEILTSTVKIQNYFSPPSSPTLFSAVEPVERDGNPFRNSTPRHRHHLLKSKQFVWSPATWPSEPVSDRVSASTNEGDNRLFTFSKKRQSFRDEVRNQRASMTGNPSCSPTPSGSHAGSIRATPISLDGNGGLEVQLIDEVTQDVLTPR